MGKGGLLLAVSSDWWASHAKLKKQKQSIKLFNSIPWREFL